jgi:peroxiredoxin
MPDGPIRVGDDAPDFELLNQDKQPVRLSSLRGRKVVLLFYPMDFSPICTEEHCSFGPQLEKIKGTENAVVYGVSTDSPFCHAAFKKQFNIPYDLLADTSRKVSKAYNLFWGEEPYNASKRGTVIINPDGKVAYWHEQPLKEVRKVDDLSKAVATAVAERANEGGSAVR